MKSHNFFIATMIGETGWPHDGVVDGCRSRRAGLAIFGLKSGGRLGSARMLLRHGWAYDRLIDARTDTSSHRRAPRPLSCPWKGLLMSRAVDRKMEERRKLKARGRGGLCLEIFAAPVVTHADTTNARQLPAIVF